MNNNSSKQILLSVIGVAILVVAVVGVSFAFFSYVNNGSANTVETGTIIFTANQNSIKLENQFPTTGPTDTQKITVTANGSTTYEKGIDFSVTVVDFNNRGLGIENGPTNGEWKLANGNIHEDAGQVDIIPTLTVTAGDLPEGCTLDVYEGNTADGAEELTKGTVLATGNIKQGVQVTNDELFSITAYYDMNKYHISENSKDELVSAKLMNSTYAGKIIHPDTWNGLSVRDSEGNVTTPAYSFTIQIIATQGDSNRPAA